MLSSTLRSRSAYQTATHFTVTLRLERACLYSGENDWLKSRRKSSNCDLYYWHSLKTPKKRVSSNGRRTHSGRSLYRLCNRRFCSRRKSTLREAVCRRGVSTLSSARAGRSTRVRYTSCVSIMLKRRYLRIGSTRLCNEPQSPYSVQKFNECSAESKCDYPSSRSLNPLFTIKNSMKLRPGLSGLSTPEKSAECSTS